MRNNTRSTMRLFVAGLVALVGVSSSMPSVLAGIVETDSTGVIGGFTLNTSINAAGYDITNITSTCGCLWNNDWVANQVFQIEITKDGSTWLSLGTYIYKPYTTATQASKVTQVVLSNAGGGIT